MSDDGGQDTPNVVVVQGIAKGIHDACEGHTGGDIFVAIANVVCDIIEGGAPSYLEGLQAFGHILGLVANGRMGNDPNNLVGQMIDSDGKPMPPTSGRVN